MLKIRGYEYDGNNDCIVEYKENCQFDQCKKGFIKKTGTVVLRLGAQSVTLLSTLRDPTQLRQLQCATTHQYLFFMAHQKEGVDLDKKNTARGFCPYFCAVDHPLWDV